MAAAELVPGTNSQRLVGGSHHLKLNPYPIFPIIIVGQERKGFSTKRSGLPTVVCTVAAGRLAFDDAPSGAE